MGKETCHFFISQKYFRSPKLSQESNFFYQKNKETIHIIYQSLREKPLAVFPKRNKKVSSVFLVPNSNRKNISNRSGIRGKFKISTTLNVLKWLLLSVFYVFSEKNKYNKKCVRGYGMDSVETSLNRLSKKGKESE